MKVDTMADENQPQEQKSGAPPFPESFVTKVVTDPGSPPAVWLLSGYPGASSKEGHMRFYLSPDLSVWLDVPVDAVAHTEQAPPEITWPPCVVAWVRLDARLTPGFRGYSQK